MLRRSSAQHSKQSTELTVFQQGDVNMPNSRGQTALYCACRQGYVEIVLELLKAPNINVNVQVTEHGGTPLHGMFGIDWRMTI